jgi:hypothetical protein
VELFEKIRREYEHGGGTIRGIAKLSRSDSLAGERDNLCGQQQREASGQNECHSPYQVQIHPRPS